MKKKFCIFLLLVFLILWCYPAFAHDNQQEYSFDNSSIYPITQWQAVYYGAAIFGILVVLILLFHKKMNNMAKKFVYILLVGVVGISTIYLILTTLHLNFISETKGPVHWHADFEIRTCGREIKLAEPKGMSNRQGVDMIHSHNDNRIHVEGVLLDRKQASLGAFFYAVGGLLSDDGIEIPTDEEMVSKHDGDSCSELPGRLYVFVNGNLTANPADYVISPYEKVPPGDRIKFVFTGEPIEKINPNLK